MTPFIASFAFFGAAALLGSEAWANGLTFSVTPNPIQPGERARLEIELPLAELGVQDLEDDAELPELRDDLLHESKGLTILDKDFKREKDTLVWQFDVTGYRVGKYRLPPVEIRYGARTFSSEALPLEVVTTRPPEDEALRDDYGLSNYPLRWKWLGLLLAAVAAGLALGYLYRRYYRRLRRWWRPPALPTLTRVPEESPESWLRRQLLGIERKLTQPGKKVGGMGSIVDELSLVLRGYFSKRFAKPVEAWTTREIARKLKTETKVEALMPVFDRCDEYRFSGNQALSPEEIAQAALKESREKLLA